MDRKGVLQRFEERLEKVIEEPFGAAKAPFDVEELKARLRAAIEETETPYVPDRWYVRFPEALRRQDAEVRAWVESVWRSLVASVEAENWPAGATPQIDVAYDPALTGEQMMVGYEFSVSAGPLYSATPRRQTRSARDLWDTQVRSRLVPYEARPARRKGNLLGSLLRFAAVVFLVAGVGLGIAVTLVDFAYGAVPRDVSQWNLPRFVVPQLAWPQLELPRLNLPDLSAPGINVPAVPSGATEYVAGADLMVRREPTAKAEAVGTIAKGERIKVLPAQIVQGEAVQGEARWVDVTPPDLRLRGEHQYVWFGGLKPVQ